MTIYMLKQTLCKTKEEVAMQVVTVYARLYKAQKNS
jgi:hypothetical protein